METIIMTVLLIVGLLVLLAVVTIALSGKAPTVDPDDARQPLPYEPHPESDDGS